MRLQSESSAFKFLRRSVDGKHLMRLQSESSVFKFLRRSVDGKHLMRLQSESSAFKFLRRSMGETLHFTRNFVAFVNLARSVGEKGGAFHSTKNSEIFEN